MKEQHEIGNIIFSFDISYKGLIFKIYRDSQSIRKRQET